MEYKVPTLTEARKWAQGLPIETKSPFLAIVSTAKLDKTYILVPKEQYFGSYDRFLICHFDHETTTAKVLGLSFEKPHPNRPNVLINLGRLTPVRLKQVTLLFSLSLYPNSKSFVRKRQRKISHRDACQASGR